MATITKNAFVAALRTEMNAYKSINKKYTFEYMASANNTKFGVIDQSELKRLYGRKWTPYVHCGYTKLTHTLFHEDNSEFKFIVIKRFAEDGGIVDGKNQVLEEIKAWRKYEETPYSDYLCPILKYFTSKSDKVGECSEKMKENVVIISQKAEFVSNARRACERAEELNSQAGLVGEDASTRYEELKSFSNLNNWWDAVNNGGNSGVIFDYVNHCYKAVFIDYAL